MHHRSLSEPLQGVSAQQGAAALRTTQDGASWWGSRSRRRLGSARCCLSPPGAAPLWVWILLGALVAPGAWSSLNEEEEELLVELHNRYRGAVFPPASAMMPLKWDPSLKVVAEGYAAKCIWNHNPDLEETGENLFAGTKPLDLQEALKEWFLEHQNYDFNNNSCDEDKMCGHYTQMVWADTHRVGCAMHLCNDMEGLNWGKSYFLVCNYYPAGNYEDVKPYVEGDWCSGCPENFQKCENNLCAEDTEEEEEGDDGEDEEATDFPSTTEPFVLPDQGATEAAAVVPPPATTDVFVPPVTTTAPITTAPPTTPAPPPGVDGTSSEEVSAETEPEATPPPGTPAPGTPPPAAAATTAGRHEDVQEEEEEEEVKEEVEKIKPAGKAEREVTVKIFQTRQSTINAGASACAASLLLASVMAILTL